MANTKQLHSHSLSHSLVSVILITHNDAEIIDESVSRIASILSKYDFFEIIAVDNGSSDATLDVLQSVQKKIPQLRITCLSRQYDIPTALTAGFDGCVGDFVVALNIYLDDPTTIEPIIEQLKTNDIVLSVNSHPDYNRQNKGVYITKKLLDYILRKNIPPDPGIYLSGFSRNAITSMTRVRRENRYQEYLSKLIGFRKATYTHSTPPPYKQKFCPVTLIGYIWHVLDASISNSFKPLRLVTVLGFIASFLNLSFLLYVFIVTHIKKNVAEGWITTSVMMGSMFFVLFVILTVISEYILRILQETRNEPLYFITREIDSISLSNEQGKLNIENL